MLIALFTSISLCAQEAPATSVVVEYSRATYDFGADQRRVTLDGPVTITTQTLLITCDRAEILSSRKQPTASPTGSSLSDASLGTIDYILATGNVDIRQMGTRATAGKAEIFPHEQRLVLEDNPRIMDAHGTVSGYRITFFQGKRQIRIDPGEGGQRNRIELNNVRDIDFLMGENPPNQ
jgi:lipopolysaccharide export system protein LptA